MDYSTQNQIEILENEILKKSKEVEYLKAKLIETGNMSIGASDSSGRFWKFLAGPTGLKIQCWPGGFEKGVVYRFENVFATDSDLLTFISRLKHLANYLPEKY